METVLEIPSLGLCNLPFDLKTFVSSLRDSWELLDQADKPAAVIQEDSQGKALLRRFLSNLIPQAFHVSAGGKNVATLRQHFNPFVYRLEVAIDKDCPIDRRLVLAGAALIAAIIQSPNGRSPYRDPAGAVKRRDLVLDLMKRSGQGSSSV